jgi:hypothetical protein
MQQVLVPCAYELDNEAWVDFISSAICLKIEIQRKNIPLIFSSSILVNQRNEQL